MPPPRSHSLEQHNYADQKKQPSNPTVIRAVEAATTGNDAATAAAASSADSKPEQESAAKNENLIMGKHSRKLCQA